MIRHAVSDLDGTLLNGSFEWDQVIEKEISRLLERGYDFAAATGRTEEGVKNCPGLWKMPVYLILMNGALILDPKRRPILVTEVSLRTKEHFLKKYPKANLEFITQKGILTRLSREAYIREYSAWDMWRKKVLDKKESGYYDRYMAQISFGSTEEEIRTAQVLKINGLELKSKPYERMLADLEESLVDAVNAPFADHVIEVTDREASKAKALLWLCDHLGWKREDIAVFGDGGNDVEMLRNFPHSYAPSDASPEAREAASQILPSNREYAVVEKIRELFCE
ncbi:MAG: HAD family phosphatase [Lachnospiraceae bacterium]|uniref:HAD-IIB family hydrolase n=1 Tax=Candidatus Merdisoma sp. JLR.KK011 TaxID=3114299 RepID=UPI001433641F|nr:HAD family phosphatase [Lachnospiraceae bacterium]GFI08867.1 HMP-PP phosphatase [Lachnospiraceae bacterium]